MLRDINSEALNFSKNYISEFFNSFLQKFRALVLSAGIKKGLG